MKKTTAEEFNKSPARIYRAADKGERVEIEHAHYPDRCFVLMAIDKSIMGDETNSPAPVEVK